MKEKSTTLLMRKWGSFLASFLVGLSAFAQINTGPLPFAPATQNFDGYLGSGATLPTGWSGSGPYVGVSTLSNPTYGAAGLGTAGEYSLGARPNSGTTVTYSVSFLNNSGSAIDSIGWSFDLEQWQNFNNRVTLTVTGTGALNGYNGAPIASLNNPALPNSRTFISSQVGTPIPDGQLFGFTFTFTSASANQTDAISIDNFSIRAVACQQSTFYRDFDGDSYGDSLNTILACVLPTGYVTDSTDCNDNLASYHADSTFYLDVDGDGYTDGTQVSCGPATNYISIGAVNGLSDCNDNWAAYHATATFYKDFDGDFYYSKDSVSCGPATNWIASGDTLGRDCNDNNGSLFATSVYRLDEDGDGYWLGNDSTSCGFPGGSGWLLASDPSLIALGDCDDSNPSEYLEQWWFEDTDLDGYYVDSLYSCGEPNVTGKNYTLSVTARGDCNDNDALVYVVSLWYLDADGDGKFLRDSLSCSRPFNNPNWKGLGYVPIREGDCDDSNPSLAASDSTKLFRDADGDLFGWRNDSIFACPLTAGYVANNTDCNDNDATRNTSTSFYRDLDGDYHPRNFTDTTLCWNGTFLPGYVEVGLALSQDCDDSNPNRWKIGHFYTDVDGDFYAARLPFDTICYGTPSTVAANTFDNLVRPTLGLDCDDLVDTVNVPTVVNYVDADGDGFGNAMLDTVVCANLGAGYSTNALDCQDTVATVYPMMWYVDADGDGYGSTDTFGVTCRINNVFPGYALNNTDCSDFNPFVYREVTVYTDNDGDGYTVAPTSQACVADTFTLPLGTDTVSLGSDCDDNDASAWTTTTAFEDKDGDGYTTTSAPISVCYGTSLPSGYVATSNGVDCNDTTTAVGLPDVYYVDADNDGYGVGTGTSYCPGQAPTTGVALNNIDCDDANANVWRNGVFYADADNDSYTTGSTVICYGATAPAGYLAAASAQLDCNDNNAAINPGATDTYGDGIDQNCDGIDGYVGIEDLTAAISAVYPNPGTNVVNITFANTTANTVDVVVRDLEGRLLIDNTVDVVNNSITVNTSLLASGLYLISVKDAVQTTTVRWTKN
jgi:hypothetical protein